VLYILEDAELPLAELVLVPTVAIITTGVWFFLLLELEIDGGGSGMYDGRGRIMDAPPILLTISL
jgi:hypothetical protein